METKQQSKQPNKQLRAYTINRRQTPTDLQTEDFAKVAQRAIHTPGTLSHSDVVILQRTIGNEAVGQVLQSKLTSTRPIVQLKCSACEKEEAKVQRSPSLSIASESEIQRGSLLEDKDTTLSNGCRKVTYTPCPGQKGEFTQIDSFPNMFLVNRGTCMLYIASLDGNARPLNYNHLELQPGESGTFFPEEDSSGVGFGCLIGCEGTGLLEHPYSCA